MQHLFRLLSDTPRGFIQYWKVKTKLAFSVALSVANFVFVFCLHFRDMGTFPVKMAFCLMLVSLR